MGHTLNLAHSWNPESIMYPSNLDQDETRLQPDDIAGIQYQYGPFDGRVSDCE